MAYVSHNTTQTSFLAPLSDAVSRLMTRMQQRRIYRTTLNELSALSDRELNDLGLSRAELRRVAYESAYPKV